MEIYCDLTAGVILGLYTTGISGSKAAPSISSPLPILYPPSPWGSTPALYPAWVWELYAPEVGPGIARLPISFKDFLSLYLHLF